MYTELELHASVSDSTTGKIHRNRHDAPPSLWPFAALLPSRGEGRGISPAASTPPVSLLYAKQEDTVYLYNVFTHVS